MGINPTQANFKSFTFDGENSRNYGVYITGQGVFNAPERNVEMIEIPNRNGAYALDKGNFNNIEVTYPAGIFADTEADFAQAVSDLRNFLCSRVGYVRLEDDYNPDEYRLAVYKSGLEVTHEMLIAGEFELKFECKPQRFLKSGETATSITSGGTLTNPTLFEAHPQLQVKGYGGIDINGEDIELLNAQVGHVNKAVYPAAKTLTYTGNTTYAFDGNTVPSLIPDMLFANGDTVSIKSEQLTFRFEANAGYYNTSETNVTDATNCSCTVTIPTNRKSVTIKCTIPSYDLTIGTDSTYTSSFKYNYNVNSGQYTGTRTITLVTTYTASTGKLNYKWTFSSAPTGQKRSVTTKTGYAIGYSTLTIPSTIYIDLDIGAVWTQFDGKDLLLNDSVQFPAELPTLPVGVSTITYDNTFTSFKVAPRWWKV